MAEIRWTAEAERWLQDIFEYIAGDNPTAAKKTVAGIYERTQTLQKWPLLGYRYEGRTNRHYRILWYGHYRIVYLVESTDLVIVIGVFHEALNLRRFLEEER